MSCACAAIFASVIGPSSYQSWSSCRFERLHELHAERNQGLPSARQNAVTIGVVRSEEHTSELPSRPHLVCRLLLEKKNGQGAAGNVQSIHERAEKHGQGRDAG